MKISELRDLLEKFLTDSGDMEVVIIDTDTALPLTIHAPKIWINNGRLGIGADYDDVLDGGAL